MARGGARPGAGRPLGSKSRRSITKIPLRAAQEHRQTIEEMPLDVLTKAMRDLTLPIELRLAAAARAAPYYHAKVWNGPPKASFEMSDSELEEAIRREKEYKLRQNPGQSNFRAVGGGDG